MTIMFQPKLARFPEGKADGGFTLTELVVVIATVAFLALFGLSLNAAVGQKGSRAYCASNLRQIGVAARMYAQDNQDKLPYIKFSSLGSTWYPYEMMRLSGPSYGQITMGPEALGMLWDAKLIKDGRVFYCPANQKGATDRFTFEFYDNPTNHWPYGGFNSGDPNGYVRSGYMYFPQNKALETSQTSIPAVGNVYLPKVNSKETSPVVSYWNVLVPMKTSEMDVSKSMVTDMVYSHNYFSHRDQNGVTGINALFGDGHVTWQGVQRVPNLFAPQIWQTLDVGQPSQFQITWRYLQSSWQP